MTFEELILQSINMCLAADADSAFQDNEEAVADKISSIAQNMEGIYAEEGAAWDIYWTRDF